MPRKQSVRSNRICFTLNNFTEEEKCIVLDFLKKDFVTYAIVGQECGKSGTPHLQGFVHLKTSYLKAKDGNVSKWKSICPGLQRAHLESAYGTDLDSKAYCSKESVILEIGVPTESSSIWNQLVNCKTMEEAKELDAESYLKYHNQLKAIIASNQPLTNIAPTKLKAWQVNVLRRLRDQDERKILFVVDQIGNSGKSMLTKFLLCNYKAFVSNGGKVADLMHIHAKHKTEYSVFDMARCNNPEYFPWNFMEMLKNGWYQSTKYDGNTVVCGVQKIVMFTNEMPPLTKLSADRYDIFEITDCMRNEIPEFEIDFI